ncbi:MAG: DUF84 family protein [Promethearchaeota archaeon]
MHFIVGSTNKHKVNATRRALDAFREFTKGYTIEASPVESFNQPINEQVKQGAIARASKSLHIVAGKDPGNNTFGVGIEGGIVHFMGRWYITAYIHVLRDSGTGHGAWTSFFECPDSIADKILDGRELGPLIDEIRELRRWTWRGGAFGTLTAETYTREDALMAGVILAVAPFFITM